MHNVTKAVCEAGDNLDDKDNLRKVVSILSSWTTRSERPAIGLTMTLELLQTLLGLSSLQSDMISETDRLQMALAIIRFVNYAVHSMQRSHHRRLAPLHHTARRLGLPRWLVSVRHEATHGRLPQAHTLHAGMLASVRWVIDNYWRRGEAVADDTLGGPAEATAIDTAANTCDAPDESQLLRRLMTDPVTLRSRPGQAANTRPLQSCLAAGDDCGDRALLIIADEMIASLITSSDGQMTPRVSSSWNATLAVVTRHGAMHRLMLALMSRHTTCDAAATWIETLVRACRDSVEQQLEKLPSYVRCLANNVPAAGDMDWRQLVKHLVKNPSAMSVRLLPVLMQQLEPSISKERQVALLELVGIASGHQVSSQSPVSVDEDCLKRHGVPLLSHESDDLVATEMDTVPCGAAELTSVECHSWKLSLPDTDWESAPALGRLPWQKHAPMFGTSYPSALSPSVVCAEDGMTSS